MNAINIALLLIGFLITTPIRSQSGSGSEKIIIDADTANEVDDLYAIALLLMDSTINVTALNATHWQTSHWATAKTMEDSHRLNQMLLGVMGLPLKTNRGGAARMYDWGDRAQHSAAAYEIINQARKLEGEQRLTVVALGALTNVASAVFIAPDIASKIRLFWLGSEYDFGSGVLSRNDFNCAMDQYALTHILFSEVEMHVMPINVAAGLDFKYKETRTNIEGGKLGDYLLKIWDDHIDSGRRSRNLWDVSIVDALLHPAWVEEIAITTSKDNGGREVFYYKSIDAGKMRHDLFSKIRHYKQP